jgi:N-acetylmuramoyl-L-alanine amidase
MKTLHQTLATLAAAAALAGCAGIATTPGGVPIVTTHMSKGQDSRVMFLVIHYTVGNFESSLKTLTEGQVSAHYLLTDEPKPRILRLVDEERRAWHSGASGWGPNRRLNASSIGIEIVHPGFRLGPDGRREYLPFPPAQIEALIPLVKDIVQRHQIRPAHILGHGEVTPSYKEDPGPTFPWRLFSQLGITPPWPDEARVAALKPAFEAAPPDAAWFQAALAQHGYNVERSGRFDGPTQRVLMNFQMRYRPAEHAGRPDAESAALLHVLTRPATDDAAVLNAVPAAQPAAQPPAPPASAPVPAAAASAP